MRLLFYIILFVFFAFTELYSQEVKKIINDISFDLNLPKSQIGLTGSLLFCDLNTVNDIDTVLYIGVRNAKDVFKKIQKRQFGTSINKKYGIQWPLQYYDEKGNLICVFISYENKINSPLYNYKFIKMKRRVNFNGIVSRSIHGLFAPSILELSPLEKKIISTRYGDNLPNLPKDVLIKRVTELNNYLESIKKAI